MRFLMPIQRSGDRKMPQETSNILAEADELFELVFIAILGTTSML